jgi:rubrerythrin
MKIIEMLVDDIDEELEGAKHYAKKALKYKDENPALAKMFFDMSGDEMKHMHMLHDEVVKIIEEHKRTKGEPPAAMLAVWDYVHKKHIKEANEVRILQNEFRT